jgi:Protein of unknown function (DUF1570)
MSSSSSLEGTGRRGIDRRAWLLQAAAGGASLAANAGLANLVRAAQEEKKDAADLGARELERAAARVRAATKFSVQTTSSDHYQAVGDASESFMKLSLADCELIAQDFLDYYGAKGFGVKTPEQRMTVVAFRDDRPFREFARKTLGNIPPNVTGFYSRTENYLVLYDSRNVPASERGGALKNMKNLAHEATHQLCFNSGLLNRKGDVPSAIVEGLACYGETRRLRGRSEPGLLNSERLDVVAHIQRRANWINTSELLTDDSPAAGRNFDRMHLFYGQSWVLIYALMNSPDRLPEFQAFLNAIFPRVDKKNRLVDAGKCFGDLDLLDQELRREAIRLQKEPRP